MSISTPNGDYLTTNIRVLSVNDIYTTSPLPLACTNILDGAKKAVNLPEDLLDPTPLTATGIRQPDSGGQPPVVLPIGGLDILKTVFDELSKGTTIHGDPVNDRNTISFLNGDILGGSLFAEHFRGESMSELLNTINPTVIGIGNHEYDYGTPQFEKLVGEAKFAWLGENITVNEASTDAEGNSYDIRPHLNLPPCMVIDFIVVENNEEENCQKDNNCHNIAKKSNATIVGRYRNIVLELLIANMLRGRCDINDYSRFLKASAENYQHIKETLPPLDNINKSTQKSRKKNQQYYLYRMGIYSVCTQFTPHLSFPSPNTTFEKPEIYALLLSLLLKTVGCHSIFLVSHLSLAGDMKIAQLSREFSRILLSYTKHTRSLPSSFLNPLLDSPPPFSPTTPHQDLHLDNDKTSTHSSYILIDTIFGGHEHEPIVMQFTEFDRSGVVVDESGGDTAQTPSTMVTSLSDDDADDLKAPTLEYIASLRAPISPFIERENIIYDPYDGPVVIKAGMNNQYTAVCDFTIHIPRRACVNHADGIFGETKKQEDKCEVKRDKMVPSSHTIETTDLRLIEPEFDQHNCPGGLRDRLNNPILYNNSEFSFTLHSDISITFSIIQHLIQTTFLEHNNLKKTTPFEFLSTIFKPFEKTPIYMSYLAQILSNMDQSSTTPGHTPLIKSSSLSIEPTPIPSPVTPKIDPNSFLTPNSPVPSLAISESFFGGADGADFSRIHKDLILPQFDDVMNRIQDSSKLQQLLDVYNTSLEAVIQEEGRKSRDEREEEPAEQVEKSEPTITDVPFFKNKKTIFTLDMDVVPETETLVPDNENSPLFIAGAGLYKTSGLHPEQEHQLQKQYEKALKKKEDNSEIIPLTHTPSFSIVSNSNSNLTTDSLILPSTHSFPHVLPASASSSNLLVTNKDHVYSEDLPSPTAIVVSTDADGNQQTFPLDSKSPLFETFYNQSQYITTALQDGILPVPIPHQNDFALSPIHYLQHYNHTKLDTLQQQQQKQQLISSVENAEYTQTDTALAQSPPQKPFQLKRYNNNTDSTEPTRIVHHPSHIYTTFSMYLIPNIQLPTALFPPQIIKSASSRTELVPTHNPLTRRDPPIPSNILKINFETNQESHHVVNRWLTQLQKDIAQGRDLEQIICHLEGSFDTRSQYGRTQGGVSGPNAVADAMEWFGKSTADAIIEYQNELFKFADEKCPGGDPLSQIDAADIPTPPDNCPIDWIDLTEILIQKKNKIKGVFSLINGGFLRGDKYYANGSNLTLGDILAELPFPKTALHALMYGNDLIRAINQELTLLPTATGAFPHFSSNVSIDYTNLPIQPSNPNGLVPLPCADGHDTFKIGARRYDNPTNPFFVRSEADSNSNTSATNNPDLANTPNAADVPKRVTRASIDGVPIDPNGLYFLTSTQFILWGGDGLTSFLRSRLVTGVHPELRWEIIGEITLDYFAYLKKKNSIENHNGEDVDLNYTPTKRVTMHRKE